MEKEFIKRLESEGYTDVRYIEGRGYSGLMRFAFTVGLVFGCNHIGYTGRYCYHNRKEALTALESWDGKEDPSGEWIKYKGEGGERSRIEEIY